VKIGGPCRGVVRARRISVQWVLAFAAAGVPVAVKIGLVAETNHSPAFVLFEAMMDQLWTTALLFPTAFISNLAFVRLFPRKTWRKERWRGMIAGGLGVILTTGGIRLVWNLTPQVPEPIRGLFGSAAVGVYEISCFVLLSNLGLLAAWLIPSRKS
jgi:hypothetical protein